MNYIVFYNTLVGIAAGVGLIGVAKLLNKLYKKENVAADGWALLFAPAGVILTVLGFAITITWPYRVPGTFDANILFGEPAIAFGLLLLTASFYLWHQRDGLDLAKVWRVLKPVSIYVFAIGLVMGACAISWVRYKLGAAPPTEPISGRVGNHPLLEASFLFVLYGLVSLGAVCFPWVASGKNPKLAKFVYWAWLVAGVVFLLFSAMNYYTHIGDLQNGTAGTNYKW
jgi:uncharacterized membrane protein